MEENTHICRPNFQHLVPKMPVILEDMTKEIRIISSKDQ